MRIDQPWLHAPETQAVCAALTEAGAQALFVGGGVRHALLGVPVSDLDIAPGLPPGPVPAPADPAGAPARPAGRRFRAWLRPTILP